MKDLTRIIGQTDDLGNLKSNQEDDDVMSHGCGECINNFYDGLQLILNKSLECQ